MEGATDRDPASVVDADTERLLVLLATPEDHRHRHLEILASIARTLGLKAGLRDRLCRCATPQEAYELLQAEPGEE